MQPIERVIFVMDRPRDVVNVGAVIRLMGNFGLRQLRLVGSPEFDHERILTIAHRGQAVLGALERYPDMPSALADCGFVLATTSRRRSRARPILAPRQAAAALLAAAQASPGGGHAPHKAAVLFGPENFGLDNESVDRSHAVLTIPTAANDASLNVAQAALLVAYELHIASLEPESFAPVSGDGGLAPFLRDHAAASASDVDQLVAAFERFVGSLHRQPVPGRTAVLSSRFRALLLRAVPSEDETHVLSHIFEHAAHRGADGEQLIQ